MSGNGLLKADNDDDEQVFVVDYSHLPKGDSPAR